MPRRNFSDGSEIVIEDFNSISKAIEREMFDRLAYELIQRAENAFFSDSFKVSYSSSTSVLIKGGYGFQTDTLQDSPEPTRRPLVLAADVTKLIASPHSVYNRIDIVCVKAEIVDDLTGTRKVKNATSSVITTETLVVQKDWQADIQIVTGLPDSSPVAPSVPTGYVKIATIAVAAVSGIPNGTAITDERTIIPVGDLATVNTLTYNRLPAGGTTTVKALFDAADAFHYRGRFNYLDVEEINSPTAEPSSPAALHQRLFYRDNVLYVKNSAGTKTPVGSGAGGGGGGANWQPIAGYSPLEDFEYNEKVWLFQQGEGQQLTLWVKVPNGYISGRQITLKFHAYSPSVSDKWKMQATSTLIRKNNDAITSTTNQNVANGGDYTNTVANRLVEQTIILSSSSGTINSIAVSAGDLLKVVLERVAPTGTDDANDIRFIPSSTEVLF